MKHATRLRVGLRACKHFSRFAGSGEVAERLKAPHSKCGIRATVSGVRIPPSPPNHSCIHAGSDEGGEGAAAIYTLIETLKLNDVDPQAWLAHVLAWLATHLADSGYTMHRQSTCGCWSR